MTTVAGESVDRNLPALIAKLTSDSEPERYEATMAIAAFDELQGDEVAQLVALAGKSPVACPYVTAIFGAVGVPDVDDFLDEQEGSFTGIEDAFIGAHIDVIAAQEAGFEEASLDHLPNSDWDEDDAEGDEDGADPVGDEGTVLEAYVAVGDMGGFNAYSALLVLRDGRLAEIHRVAHCHMCGGQGSDEEVDAFPAIAHVNFVHALHASCL